MKHWELIKGYEGKRIQRGHQAGDLERLPLPSTEGLERVSLPELCKVTTSWTD